MTDISIHQLSEPRRQSPVAIFMFIFRFFKRFINAAWFIVIYLFIGSDKSSIFELSISAVILVISGGILLMSVLSYFRYFYFVDGQSFNIHKGVFGRQKINLPFERIQNINFEQKIIHQIFGVVSLQIDTAGSTGNEIKVEALPKAEAEAIRDYILEQKRELSLSEVDEEGTEEAAIIEERIPDKLLLSLSIPDLVKIGISQNHIKTAFIILGIGWGFMDNIEDLFKVDFFDLFLENADRMANSFLVPIVFLLIIAFFITLIRTILRHFNLRFYKSHEGFKVTSGLFTRQEVALRREKVQIIKWTDNPIRKLFKIFTLDIKQAVSGIVVNRKQKAEVPGCYQHQVDEVLYSCFPDYETDTFKEHQIDFAFVMRRFIYFGLIPALPLMAIFYFSGIGRFLILAIAVPVLVFFFLWLYHRKYRVYFGTEYMQVRKGIFATTNLVFPYYKVQAIDLVQSIYQRKKGLANVVIHTANGAVGIPYFDLEKSRALKNYMLYKVESSDRAWM